MRSIRNIGKYRRSLLNPEENGYPGKLTPPKRPPKPKYQCSECYHYRNSECYMYSVSCINSPERPSFLLREDVISSK